MGEEKQMQIRRGYPKGRKWVMNEDRTAIFPLWVTSAHVLKYQGQIMGYHKIPNKPSILGSNFKI
jgi:hypothetical protein